MDNKSKANIFSTIAIAAVTVIASVIENKKDKDTK